MAFNVNDFKAAGLTFGGARPTLFQVTLNLPQFVSNGGAYATKKIAFTCRATSVPASTISAIEVPYFGRKVKVAGDRTFADWQVTIINDEDFWAREALEIWSNAINSHVGNKRIVTEASDPASLGGYRSNAYVTQYAKGGLNGLGGTNNAADIPLRQYQFWNIFPTNIDTMDLDWDATNQLQTFGVTFSYDYWTPVSQSNITMDTGGGPGQLAPTISA